ncbi:hypothetical protein [Tumebacillus permanentifrigoris]|uniref:EF-hand domain-containing protein n=1 Tax=Tumebacillus permanentifrigoris TaxID=378543 RepID=A0A316D2D0_9BACL|nr:hypothetical protein [Tumebacillus permanentifrigoris]PWK03963.1 hypothetical protein C7459_1363 [Tumebacillus permanentifrigoris]
MTKTGENEFVEPIESPSNPLAAMQQVASVLTRDEEYAFMQILFSSSATVRNNNFGLPKREVEKLLGTEDPHAFDSFLNRLNHAISRYFRCVYDERRDRVVVIMRVPARQAREVLSAKSLSLLMYIFYHQDVLQNEYTLFTQLFTIFGHESMQARTEIQTNLEPLIKIGAISKLETTSQEVAYSLTVIGSQMFSDSFLKRYTEFSQSQQLNKEEVLRFFKRYNLQGDGTL